MEGDITNFSSSSSHRLPTISASQALQKLSTPRKQWVSTALTRLDEVLRGRTVVFNERVQNASTGGFAKGQLTEIYGPPGSGKTALALQAAAGSLYANEHVVWIDCSHRIAFPRIKEVLASCRNPSQSQPASQPPVHQSIDDQLGHLHHFTVPALPHLLALVCHSPQAFPPQGAALIVIDGVSGLFGAAFPDRPDNVSKTGKKHNDLDWASNRRFSIMGDLLTNLSKLAAISNLAVVLISQTGIKVKHDYGAILRPAISSKTWSDNINNRLVTFRDFPRASSEKSETPNSGIRFAGIVKLNGTVRNQLSMIVPFSIKRSGVYDIETNIPTASVALTPGSSPPKLKRKRTEVADSESEDGASLDGDNFDWVEDDALALDDALDDEAVIAEQDHQPPEDRLEAEAT